MPPPLVSRYPAILTTATSTTLRHRQLVLALRLRTRKELTADREEHEFNMVAVADLAPYQNKTTIDRGLADGFAWHYHPEGFPPQGGPSSR